MTLSWDSWRQRSVRRSSDGGWVGIGCANLHSIGTHRHEWFRLATDDVLVYRKLAVTAADLEIRKLAGFQ